MSMRSLQRSALLCLLVAAAATAQSSREVWKWVDRNGVTHYSDTPVEGATRVPLFGLPPPKDESASDAPQTAAPAAKPVAAPAVVYERLEFEAPGNGETFFNADAEIPVSLVLEPELGERDTVVLYLDGKRVADFPARGLQHRLVNVERGAHTLTAAIFNERADSLIQSAPRVFYLRQNTTLNPASGQPQPRPQPKPKR